MGSPQSKVEAPKNVESQTNMIQESSGSHFLEIHAPTAGIGLFTIFAILLAFICLFGLYRKCKRHTQRRPQQLGNFPGMSFQYSDPMHGMGEHTNPGQERKNLNLEVNDSDSKSEDSDSKSDCNPIIHSRDIGVHKL